jgi:putative SOS response-associated peptidase YedK
MCCRYVLLKEDAKSLLEKLGVLLEAGAVAPTRYNISPGGRIPAIRTRASTPAPQASSNPIGYSMPDGGREFIALHWGLTPSWARDNASPVVNARAETLTEKPTFRDALRSRRCLIPASGFYEWKVAGRAREPWLFRLRDNQPFALAGLWETWRAPDGTAHESCAVITTAPNTIMEPVHHRMPAILADSAAWDAWLDPRITSSDTLAPLLWPFSAAAMTAIAVSPRVNNTRHDTSDCLLPAGVADEPQLPLGF